MTNFCVTSPRCSSPAGSRTRGTGRAARRPPPGRLWAKFQLERRTLESVKGVHLDTEVTLPEVHIRGRRMRDDLLLLLLHLDECRVVALAILVRFQVVGESRHVILQLQTINDLTPACSHHFENSEQTRPEPKDDSPTLV